MKVSEKKPESNSVPLPYPPYSRFRYAPILTYPEARTSSSRAVLSQPATSLFNHMYPLPTPQYSNEINYFKLII